MKESEIKKEPCENCGRVECFGIGCEPFDEDSFDTCANCDQPDACADFCECAIKVGLRNDPEL
ncbi:hypothetical protein [Peijinzhouia sedimentorum]